MSLSSTRQSSDPSLFRRLLKNASYLFSANAIRSLGLFAQVVLVGRALGPDLYGVLAQALVAVALIVELIDLRVWEFIHKYLSEFIEKGEDACAKALIKLGYLLDGLTGLIAFAIVVLSAPLAAWLLDEPRVQLLIYIIAARSLFATINQTSNAVLQALDRFAWISAETVAHTVVMVLVILLVTTYAPDIETIAYAYVFNALVRLFSLSLLAGIAIRSAFRGKGAKGRIGLLRERFREMAAFLLQTALNATLKLFGRNIDVLILGAFRESAEVGLYRIAKDFMSVLYGAISAVTASAFPELGRLWARADLAGFTTFVKKLTGLLAALLIPAALIMIVGCELLIRVAVGPEFVGASTAIRIIIWGALVYGIFSWAGSALTVMGRPVVVTLSTFSRNIVLIALSFVVVPPFGLAGAAAAMTISDLVGRGSLWLFYLRSKRQQSAAS